MSTERHSPPPDEAEDRYRQLVESSPDGIVLHRDGSIIFCNQAFARMLGYDDSAQVVGRSLLDVVNRTNRRECNDRIMTLTQDDERSLVPLELELLRVDGRHIPVELSSAPVKLRGRSVVQSVVRDLTERRKTQAALVQQARFFIAVLESLTHPFYVIDTRDYTILLANSAAGFPDEKAAHTCYQLTHGATQPCNGPDHVCPLAQVKRTGQPFMVEHTHLAADGQQHRVEVHGYPVFDDQHNVVQMIEYIIDVTDKVRLQEQLQLAQRLSAVGQIAGGIAHDFNNLVAVIMSTATLLTERCPHESELREAVETIKHAASTAGKLTSGLLAFSRQQPTQLEPVALASFAKDLEPMIRSLLGQSITLEIEARSSHDLVDADKSQLERVLINLVLNARDAMPEGGTLRITTDYLVIGEGFLSGRPWGEAGPYVVLEVADTGSGMDERTRLQAFEPFFTTKNQGKGTGLGLASVYGIVKKHGGMIELASELDSGTTATIYLAARTARPVTTHGGPREIVSGGGETVLIVEDQAGLRRIVERYLTAMGYATLVAENGAQALSLLSSTSSNVDLVFSDLVMPVMGGREMYDQARRLLPDTPFLFCSGYDSDRQQKVRRDDSQISFIAKPYELPLLAKMIRRLLDQRA